MTNPDRLPPDELNAVYLDLADGRRIRAQRRDDVHGWGPLFEYRSEEGELRFYRAVSNGQAWPKVIEITDQVVDHLVQSVGSVRHLVQQDALERRGRIRQSDGPAELRTDRKSKVKVARWGDDGPTPERRQHSRTERQETFVQGRGRAYAARTIDTIGKLLETGEINGTTAKAGRRFQGIFHKAHVDPLAPPDLGRIPGQSGGVGEQVENARTELGYCIKALGGHGSPVANAAWFVLGAQYNMREFARREAFGHGKALRSETVNHLVISALEILKEHFDQQDRWGNTKDA